MSTITRSISSKVAANGESEIFLRVCVARGKVYRVRSGVTIRPERFRDGKIIKPKANQFEIAHLRQLEERLGDLENEILNSLVATPVSEIDKTFIEGVIADFHNPPTEDEGHPKDFFEAYEAFLKVRDLSINRADIYKSLGRCLHRFEVHQSLTRPGYKLTLDGIGSDDLRRFQDFYRSEWKLYDEFPEIYTQYPVSLRTQHKTHRPQKRGENIVINMMRKLRAFMNWCYQQELTDNRPFERFDGMKSERYGTPFFLTLAERDHLADFDFSSRPGLAAQRDIFVFQCLIGCRVSDLTRLERSNIVNGIVEYVAKKTRRNSVDVVRVPLNERAKALIKKYDDPTREKLFPFISDQRYNEAIKEMLRLAGIDRIVTIINPKTGEDERRPIWQVASSHMARRTFIGNLYKKVKDQNLISSLSGHTDGSRAFTRYRFVDDEIKKDLIDLLE